MTVRPLGAGACAALFLLLGLGGRSHAALPAAALEVWAEARSEHFTVYTNRSEHDAQRAARHLERLAEVLSLTTQGLVFDGREVRVFLFRDRKSFQPFNPLASTDDEQYGVTGGFRVAAPAADLIVYYQDGPDPSNEVAAHEYLHVVANRTCGRLPRWFDEGLADFYSTFVAGARTADIGRPEAGRLLVLQRNKLLPLRQLFAIEHWSHEYKTGAQRPVFYSQSWALVHMLALTDQKSGRFAALFEAFRRGLATEQALTMIYGPNAIDSLDRAVQAYVSRTSMNYSKWKFSGPAEAVEVRTRWLPEAETRRLLGELAMRTHEGGATIARELLAAAAAEDSSTGLESALLAELACREEERERALAAVASVDRAPRPDPRALGIAGRALAGLALWDERPSWPAAGADTVARSARRLLERALERQPDQLDWLVPYGHTFVEDATGLSDGVTALTTAYEAEPWSADAIGGLACLLVRAGNRVSALVLYRQLPSTPEGTAWKSRVGYLIARRTMLDAEHWFAEGRKQEAESLLTRLPQEVPVSGLAYDVENLLASLRQRSVAASGDARRPSTTAAAATSPSAGPRATTPSATPRARALAAARRGDFGEAERQVEGLRRTAAAPAKPGLDSLAAEVRNIRRLKSAEAMVQGGRLAEACAIWRAILADLPRPATRKQVTTLRGRYCGAAD